MLGYVPHLPSVALMPLNLLAEHHEALQEYKKGIAEFCAMKDLVVCCTVQDPATAVPSGYNDKASVALWTRGGKLKMDPELYVRVLEALRPDWAVCLADADTCKTASKKRCKKAVDNTLNFLDDVLAKTKHSEVLQQTSMFGSVGGGFNHFERQRSAKEMAARNVDGFALEGFQNDGEEFCQFADQEFADVLQHTLKHLPEDRPRMMCAVWRPDMVIQAVRAGIDIFDTSYTYTAAEKHQALTFDFNYSAPAELGWKDNSSDAEKIRHKTQNCGFTIDLSDKRYSADFGPVLKGCECYTCRTFSRAYIHHLINTTELQRGVLLMIHNLHHYLAFFRAVRQSLREDKFGDLESLILSQTADSESKQ
ncbi:queuine tRNA-ribosyltransferase accessory subunit 2-like isoform X2 [Babylonia areolata]